MSYQNKTPHELQYQEIANTLTHAVGVLIFSLGSVLLLIKAHRFHDILGIASAWIYSLSLVVLHASSALYHYVSDPSLKKSFKLIDHCAIFLLIAGTYTPFLMLPLRNEISYSFLITMWSIAAAGILYKVFMIKKYRLLSTAIYLAMGWMALFKINEFYQHLSGILLAWIVAGGLCYSAGTIFYSKEKIPYNHAIWHIFVLCGSACHFIAIYLYVY